MEWVAIVILTLVAGRLYGHLEDLRISMRLMSTDLVRQGARHRIAVQVANLLADKVRELKASVKCLQASVQIKAYDRDLKELRRQVIGDDKRGPWEQSAISELREQVEGINTRLGHDIERLRNHEMVAVRTIAQSAARKAVAEQLAEKESDSQVGRRRMFRRNNS